MKTILRAMRNYYNLLGPIGPFAFLAAKAFRFTPTMKAHIDGIKTPIYIRVGKTDASCAIQVLREKQYDYPIKNSPSLIIDAGANIGSASVFFANKFPNARIIAIEPEASNVAMLKRNTASYPNVEVIAGALWYKTGTISLVDPANGHHAFQTKEESGNNLVPAVTIDQLLREHKMERVDILKIDIEGAETEVFDHSQPWINKVDVIMAELHPHIRPECDAIFQRATHHFPTRSHQGETVLCMI